LSIEKHDNLIFFVCAKNRIGKVCWYMVHLQIIHSHRRQNSYF